MDTCSLEEMSLSQANNHLAVNLHCLLAKDKKNVLFSPFSNSAVMAMLLSAASGNTESELRAALGYDHARINRSDFANVFERYMSLHLKSPDSYTLSIANSMLCQYMHEVKEGYKQLLAEVFKTVPMTSITKDFFYLTHLEKEVNLINEWAKEKTNNMIPKLVDSPTLPTLALLNAIYFKGSWLHQFKKLKTSRQKFYNNGIIDNAKDIDMMHTNNYFPFYENTALQVLQLPYVSEEIAMFIILPRSQDGLNRVEANLTTNFVQDLKKNLSKEKVEVSLPRFRLQYTKPLLGCFLRLDVKCAFSGGDAELGIASDLPNLAVSSISHEAIFDVKEEGIEVTAVTMVRAASSMPTYFCNLPVCVPNFFDAFPSITNNPVFNADHPFLFLISDTRSELDLFMGRVIEL